MGRMERINRTFRRENRMKFICKMTAELGKHGDPPSGAPLGSVGPQIAFSTVVVIGSGRSEEEAIREAGKAFEIQAFKLAISDGAVEAQAKAQAEAQQAPLKFAEKVEDVDVN
jgi:hypothetical protein